MITDGGNEHEITLGRGGMRGRSLIRWPSATVAWNYFHSDQSWNRAIEIRSDVVALAPDSSGYCEADWLARVASFAQTLHGFCVIRISVWQEF